MSSLKHSVAYFLGSNRHAQNRCWGTQLCLILILALPGKGPGPWEGLPPAWDPQHPPLAVTSREAAFAMTEAPRRPGGRSKL